MSCGPERAITQAKSTRLSVRMGGARRGLLAESLRADYRHHVSSSEYAYLPEHIVDVRCYENLVNADANEKAFRRCVRS